MRGLLEKMGINPDDKTQVMVVGAFSLVVICLISWFIVTLVGGGENSKQASGEIAFPSACLQTGEIEMLTPDQFNAVTQDGKRSYIYYNYMKFQVPGMNEKQYVKACWCPECSKSFIPESWVKTKRVNLRDQRCPHCGKDFVNPQNNPQ